VWTPPGYDDDADRRYASVYVSRPNDIHLLLQCGSWSGCRLDMHRRTSIY
jgi:hypothetical protein